MTPPAAARPRSPRRPRPAPRSLAALLVPCLLLGGCGFFAPTVTVDRVGPDEIYEELNAFVIDSGDLSTGTRDVLHTAGLSDLVDDEPREALEHLHAIATADPYRQALFALSELAFLIGDEDDDPDAYLASAIYAYLYLFGEEQAEPPNPYDRRFRQACDLYNGALLRASRDGREVEVGGGERTLPVGRITLTADRSEFPFTEAEYPEFLPADDYTIDGLTLRLRDAGLGVALIAEPDPTQAQIVPTGPKGAIERIVNPDQEPDPGRVGLTKLPATLFLRVHGGLGDFEAGLTGTVELHQTLDSTSVTVAGRQVPLEADVSVVIAYALHRSPLWKFSLRGLFEGDAAVKENRLLFARTPERGRIPVVFVHGTASNPAYWAEMFNVLMNDPVLRTRTQAWFFQYASGNPLLYSAMTLRQQLQAVIERLDPDGTDPDLRRMVLVSHSQGGLVSKLMVLDGDLGWLEEVLEEPVEDLGFDEKQMELLTRAYEFDPLPFVDRVVFLATPHRGSFQAARWYSRITAKFIALPRALQSTLGGLFEEKEQLPAKLRGRIPTSLDNMSPGNPLLGIMNRESVPDDVALHSIIPIGDADPDVPEELAEADDGVVEYTSAHIEPVESERLLPGSHSCQDHPTAIAEVRRILRLHVGSPAPAWSLP